MSTSKKTTRLREFFTSPGTEVLPMGALPVHAQMAEAGGFGAFQISGAFSSWWLNGQPDVGLMTRTEVMDNARRVVQSVDIPVYCDADTGFGGIQNVGRTVQEFIHAGIAGIHIEDQLEPKKAGGQAGIAIVSDEEAIGRLNAACEVRDKLDKDFVITARTDAYAVAGGGLEEALRRGRLYREKTGADVIFYEGIRNREDWRYLLEQTPGPAYVIPSRHAGPTPPVAQLSEWGQAVQIFNFAVPSVQAVWKLLLKVRDSGELAAYDQYIAEAFALEGTEEFVGFGDRFVKPTYQQVRELEERFLPASLQRDYENSTHD
ncbi:isocitrate lyase/PEP mutase family protein [Pseudarthrobacter sp. fls2-241-R2A-168]|uniref:isocitrate lyase/PEP mutase family protein n=1 Tax=Pseudarthrobacter sp. fls2-241-R2A-168 TaxID=3040304 RepID=UPI002553BB0D|nr:isocitrate lyase/PEP mutase family protein [Pseudarthrobacter sp. fls2-241-R2A-168]